MVTFNRLDILSKGDIAFPIAEIVFCVHSEHCMLQTVFVQWNFFVFNVLKGHSATYGTHPWHWYTYTYIYTQSLTDYIIVCNLHAYIEGIYLTEGVPVVVGTALPLLVILPYIHWRNGGRGVVSLTVLGGWVILAHSLLSHKEFRFIMQVIPITSVLADEKSVKKKTYQIGYVLSYLFSLRMYRGSYYTLKSMIIYCISIHI